MICTGIKLKDNFGEGYDISIIPMFKVRVWNGDNYLNKHIKISLKLKAKVVK